MFCGVNSTFFNSPPILQQSSHYPNLVLLNRFDPFGISEFAFKQWSPAHTDTVNVCEPSRGSCRLHDLQQGVSHCALWQDLVGAAPSRLLFLPLGNGSRVGSVLSLRTCISMQSTRTLAHGFLKLPDKGETFLSCHYPQHRYRFRLGSIHNSPHFVAVNAESRPVDCYWPFCLSNSVSRPDHF